MKAIILSVGDELVLGQTVDTNSAWISKQLAAVGCDIAGHATVPDDQPAIEAAINQAAARCDFLIISGGIGPTEDDLTRQALAAVLKQPLEENPIWMSKLIEFFKARGRPMPEINKIQAMIPHGATMIDNTAGTAAGIEATISPCCRIFVMPGVPKEMKAMFTGHVLPIIAQSAGGAAIVSATLHTFGLGESAIAEKLGPLMQRTRNPSVGTTIANGVVSLRINARFPNKNQAQTELTQTTTACRGALGDLIYGQDEQTLPQIVVDLLRSTDSAFRTLHSSLPTVSTAESCTGGLVAKMLTDIPGSSAIFTQGWVTYSNQAKYERLGISMEIINLHGAVSEKVVEAMATNARRLSKSTFALAISGIAGPGGGSAAKPVGTVCIALAVPPLTPGEGRGEGQSGPSPSFAQSTVITRTFLFPGDREMIRDRSAKTALTMLRFHLLGKPLPF